MTSVTKSKWTYVFVVSPPFPLFALVDLLYNALMSPANPSSHLIVTILKENMK